MTVRFNKQRHDRDLLRTKLKSNKYQKLQRSRAAVERTLSALKRSQSLILIKLFTGFKAIFRSANIYIINSIFLTLI